MTSPDPRPAAGSPARLRALLAASGDPMRLALNDALYQAQIRYTCDLLQVADEVLDPVAAELLTEAISERLAGAGARDADRRLRETAARAGLLSASPSFGRCYRAGIGVMVHQAGCGCPDRR